MKIFNTLMLTGAYAIYCSLFLAGILFILTACGTTVKVKGTTEHKAEISGTATQVNEVVLKIDVSACDKLEGKDQPQCIKDIISTMGDLVEMVKSMYCKTPECFQGVVNKAVNNGQGS